MDYHKIKDIDDQEQMLEEILSLQSDIRSQREKTRRLNTAQHEKYTRIFEPVTKSIAKLAPQPGPQPAPAQAPPSPAKSKSKRRRRFKVL